MRRLVTCTDFVILNCLLLVYTEYGTQITPDYFDTATKITFFVANVALFLSEYNYFNYHSCKKDRFPPGFETDIMSGGIYRISVLCLCKTAQSWRPDVLFCSYLWRIILFLPDSFKTLRT